MCNNCLSDLEGFFKAGAYWSTPTAPQVHQSTVVLHISWSPGQLRTVFCVQCSVYCVLCSAHILDRVQCTLYILDNGWHSNEMTGIHALLLVHNKLETVRQAGRKGQG